MTVVIKYKIIFLSNKIKIKRVKKLMASVVGLARTKPDLT